MYRYINIIQLSILSYIILKEAPVTYIFHEI